MPQTRAFGGGRPLRLDEREVAEERVEVGEDPLCGGDIIEIRSRRKGGKTFYGCNNYSKTKCDFAAWDKPKKQPCPNCGATFVVERQKRDGSSLKCVNPECGWMSGAAPEGENEVDADENAA